MMRMRTIPEAAKYFKNADPETCITVFRLRQLVNSGAIPSTKAGKKYMVSLEEIEGFFGGTTSPQPAPAPQQGIIRPIKV